MALMTMTIIVAGVVVAVMTNSSVTDVKKKNC